MKKLVSLIAALLFIYGNLAAQYSGENFYSIDLNKQYSECIFVTTHNAYNYKGDFQYPNQNFPVSQQMIDGVRGFMLDVYMKDGEVTVYHVYPTLGNQPLLGILKNMKSFMEQNPNEILTIIFESYVSSAEIDTVFNQAGLLPYLYEHPLGQQWPKLQEMVDSRKQMVVFSDKYGGSQLGWYHYVWNYTVETHFSNLSTSDFSSAFNRGAPGRKLFILNHFITHPQGVGLEDSAKVANANPYLISRCLQAWNETGKIPNFLTVDFYDQGDVFETAAILNNYYTVSGTITANGSGINGITWNNTVTTYTRGYYSFPVDSGANITLTPGREGYFFNPPTVSWTNVQESKIQNFIAERSAVGIEENKDKIGIPHTHFLSQNYPNPFNPLTNIFYSIPKSGLVSIKVYNILGKEIQTLVSEFQMAGAYSINFDASEHVSGVYFYKVQVGSDFVETKKMLLLR